MSTRPVSPRRRPTPHRPPRIGILGGTFDPIHLAHLRCAEEAREALDLDQVIFVPSASPPHKSRRRVAPAHHRLQMVRLALAGNPAFRASSLEIERAGRSYSVDTLRTLRQRLPRETRLVFLMGADAFREIGSWKQYRALFGLADIAVFSRPPHRDRAARTLLPVAARAEFCYGADRKTLLHESGNRVLFLTVTSLDISASDIRRRLRRGRSIRYLVPPAVEHHLRRARLYTRRSSPS